MDRCISIAVGIRSTRMCLLIIFCDISFNLNRFLCYDYSLESSRRDDSNEWSQHRNRLRNTRVNIRKAHKRKEYLQHNLHILHILNGACLNEKAVDFLVKRATLNKYYIQIRLRMTRCLVLIQAVW